MSSLNLTTRTNIERQQYQKLKNICQNLIDHNDSVQFRQPVDWEAFGLIDYPTIIKKPMDLGTVQSKLNNADYLFIQDVIDDIQLIWDNCKTYNLPGSWIYNLADKLEKNFKKMLKNYLPLIPFSNVNIKAGSNIPVAQPQQKSKSVPIKKKEKIPPAQQIFVQQVEQKISYEQKVDFSQKLKPLSPQNLGLVVQRILNLCPTAFSDIGGERVQILLQNIDTLAFRDLNGFVDSLINQEAYKGSKKIKLN